MIEDRMIPKIITIFTLFLCACVHDRSLVKLPLSFHNNDIESIIDAVDKDINIGVKIVSLHDNKVVFSKNADRHFIPASTTKLITVAAALYYLGPSFRFNTKIFSDKHIDKEGHINNLYIEGSGDPGLMDSDVISLVHELKQMGLKSIDQDIIIDDSIFDDVLWGTGAMWDDRNRGFSAPVSGLNMNFNRLLIKIIPSYQGHLSHVIISPFSEFIAVNGHVLTQKGSSKNISLDVKRHHKHQYNWPKDPKDGLYKGDKILLKGHLGQDAKPHYTSLAINDPGIFIGHFIAEQLKNAHIHFSGQIKRQIRPNKTVELTNHLSLPLAQYLIDFTKISNNLANDVLIKAIAAKHNIKPASFNSGLKLVRDFLKTEVNIDSDSLIAVDGAGLSRYNLITPNQLINLLLYAHNHFHFGPEYIASLAIGGEDGLLINRFTNDDLRKNIRAKTGTVTGISCLAGYFMGKDRHRYAFAIMINNFIGPVSKYTKLQDQILSSMILPDPSLAKAK